MYVLVSAVLLLLVVGALVDIITKHDGQVKHLPKVVWILLVVFLPVIGSILWFVIGREYIAPVDRGSFGNPQRREVPTSRQVENDGRRTRTTEDELAELERKIDFHSEQARIRRLEALGRMLQQGRLVSGLTQRDLAARLETDQKYIWTLESGKNTIILERIFAIMRETGVRMYMEIDDSPNEPPSQDIAEEPHG